MYRLFSQHRLSDGDYKILEMLRNDYRKRNRIKISAVETTGDGDGPVIPDLSRFLYEIRFVPRQAGFINKSELEYLTGGWFEEYVYYLVKKYVKPQDIAIGIKISRAGVRHDNELDVVFTKGNKLFVIECKTGVKTERLFNEIVYKACAIKEALLGVSCYSYIFSLTRDDKDNTFKLIAGNMDIIFYDHDILTKPRKLHKALTDICVNSKDGITSIYP